MNRVRQAPFTRILGAALGLLIALSACSGSSQASPSLAGSSVSGSSCPTSAPPAMARGDTATVTMQTSKGAITIKVEGALGPSAAGNFVALARCGFYEGVTFHRLVPGFVIQGGDPKGNGTGGPGYTIDDDPVTTHYGRGVVAMARTPAPHSEGSQFFIVLDDAAQTALQDKNNYAIFGRVTAGMATVDAIAAMPNSGGQENQALQPVQMTKLTVSTP